MKKALKIIGILLGVIVLAVVVIGLIAPKEGLVERSISINAPVEMVKAEVSSFKSFTVWNPFDDQDSAVKQSMEGTDGTVGSKFIWDGPVTGTGHQTISAITDSMVSIDLVFTKPFESESKVYYKYAANGDSTKLTWGYTSHYGFVQSIVMMLFVDMDKMLGGEYEKGLASVKTIIEAKTALPKLYGGFEINEATFPAQRYLAITDSIPMDSIMSFHKKTFATLGAELGKAKIQPTGNPVGVYFSWDMANKTTKLADAMPIDSAANITKIKKGKEWKSEASKALKMVYTGDYSKMEAAHKGFYQYMTEHKLTMGGMVIEEYVVNPMMEQDSSKWVTNIFYLVK
ncbi:MAG: SRPBCC family protein [Bacteroidetes bacterium]|nr:SRPBCC family protein [Bacteroidota bacterium]